MGARKGLPDGLTLDPWNIVSVFLSADDATLDYGLSWYTRANEIAASLVPDDSVSVGAGLLAALSPQTSWLDNVSLARRAVADGVASGQTSDNVNKANQILWHYGEPLDVLGGPKVRAFYAAILDPTDPIPVCVDRHAFDVAVGQVTSDRVRNLALNPF